jgi:hypothetical protein
LGNPDGGWEHQGVACRVLVWLERPGTSEEEAYTSTGSSLTSFSRWRRRVQLRCSALSSTCLHDHDDTTRCASCSSSRRDPATLWLGLSAPPRYRLATDSVTRTAVRVVMSSFVACSVPVGVSEFCSYGYRLRMSEVWDSACVLFYKMESCGLLWWGLV